jgi:hypothetical protein
MNRKKYDSKNVVSSYIKMTLQNPEVMILVKHRERIVNKHIRDIGCGSDRTTAILRNFSVVSLLEYGVKNIQPFRGILFPLIYAGFRVKVFFPLLILWGPSSYNKLKLKKRL